MRRLAPALFLIVLALPATALAGATLRVDDQRSITVAVGVRTAYSSAEEGALDGKHESRDPAVEAAILAFSGEVIPQRLRIQVNGGRGPLGELRVTDAMVQIEPSEHFRLWAGRLLPPSDRASFTGPFFGTSWDPPIVVVHPSVFAGRDDGVVAWGTAYDGLLKYQAGAFRGRDGGPNDNDELLYAGRLAVNLLSPEPGYYSTGTYHGTRDVLTVAIGTRVQRHGIGTDNPQATPPVDGDTGTLSVMNADLLFEKRIGRGALTFEGAFYGYDHTKTDDPVFRPGWGHYESAAILLPWSIAGARFQPSGRFQRIDLKGSPERTRWDATLNVILYGHFAKAALTMSGERVGHGETDETRTVKAGIQIIL